MIFGPEGLGSSCAEICFIAVDIAIAQACLDAFERELRIKADKPRPKTALGYLRVLRLRASGDYEGLYQVIRSAGMTSLEPHYWEETRRRDPVAAEAAECLGELGDAAFEWLCGRARVESEKKAALIAIAHFKTAKALDFIRALPVRPDTRDALDIRCLEKIHAAPVRARSYPPRREPMK
jgi:hypothetical protein